MCRSKSGNAEKGLHMNIIQNYGIRNYQTNFQARGDKRLIKQVSKVTKNISLLQLL